MLLIRIELWNKFIVKTYKPEKHQSHLLKSILRNQLNTQYAKDNNFPEIDNYDDYKKKVSVNTYEDLKPYIDKQNLESKPYINIEQHIFCTITSGTTNSPKLIPVTKKMVQVYKKSQSLMSYAYYQYNRKIYQGKILAIVSPTIEGRLDSGLQYGSMSGLISSSMSKFARYKYVVPEVVFEIKDYDAKYYYICLFALNYKDITFIATANPSTIIKINQVIFKYRKKLLRDLNGKNLKNTFKLPDIQFALINKQFNQNLARVIELQNIIDTENDFQLKNIWPNLQVISMWTGGSVGVTTQKVKKIAKNIDIFEMGYLSSEFRGSININPKNNTCIPTINEVFFEFILVDDYHKNSNNYLLINEIEAFKKYYVVVTTQFGLYRYFMNDIIETGNYYNNTPTIKFIQKGSGIGNITGEKIYETQVIEAIKQLESKYKSTIDFFIMVADADSLGYELFVQTKLDNQIIIADDFEYFLGRANIEFQSKRDSGRLNKTKVILLNDCAGENYKKYCIANGQREGQFKYLIVQNKETLDYDFYKDRKR